MHNVKFVLLLYLFPFAIILFGCLFVIPCTLLSLMLNICKKTNKAKYVHDLEETAMRQFNHYFFKLLTT